MVEENTALNIGLALLLAYASAVGVLLLILFNKSEKQEGALSDHRVATARDYITRNEIDRIEDNIGDRFDRMERWIGRRFDTLMGRPVQDEGPGDVR